MSTNEEYQPINCDDYDNLELACQRRLVLTITLRNGDTVTGMARDMFLRKQVEYLAIDESGVNAHELRLDHIVSFVHPELGIVVVSE
ncbi:Rho-binding antiterminator [Acerihabitans sp. TG2]|uniref:Rho-binding antiterminator n=1 Tax=Acerihabitans sp. TG2 TaxID=3096008 RepID=UPI002B225E4D|nr:Rho-binding antiterminator [Acerihabitans sp. TG2]MEA9393194.1 Rho-binding antiterminator [Acerihabitans sp. TG2]